MSCNCCCGADERRNVPDTSEAQLRAEHEKQPLEERITQLEAELQALRSTTSKG